MLFLYLQGLFNDLFESLFLLRDIGRLYRDGLVVKKNISIPSIEPSTGKVTKLGATHGVGRGWPTYVGRIDEVRIWNRALSEDEVEALFSFEPPQAVAPQGKLATMWGRVKYDR